MFLFYDTETTGKAAEGGYQAPGQPRLVQLAAILTNEDLEEQAIFYTKVRPEGWEIPQDVVAIHGITTSIASAEGLTCRAVLYTFLKFYNKSTRIICHNIWFDKLIMRSEFFRIGAEDLPPKPEFCTMMAATPICKLPPYPGKGGFKWPKLEECMLHFYGYKPTDSHNALADVRNTIKVYKAIQEHGAKLQGLD